MQFSGLAFWDGKLYATTLSSIFPRGAVLVFTESKSQYTWDRSWQRTQVIYMPSTCVYSNTLSVGVDSSRIFVCNRTNGLVYVFSTQGKFIREHADRKSSHMCALDEGVMLEAEYGTKLSILDQAGRWHDNVIPELTRGVQGAVVYDKKLYVASLYLQMFEIF